MHERPTITVVGSVNLDIVAAVSRLPLPGETVSGAELHRFPGGKGANQALAARRLGADVCLVACVGDDANADEALALLEHGGVDLSCCIRDPQAPTGVALIAVAADGENQIVVAPGANRALRTDKLTLPAADAMVCQLEVPVDTLLHAAEAFDRMFCINLAPACDVPAQLIRRAELIVVNETEADFYGSLIHECDGLVVTTLGASGAVACKNGREIARVAAPKVDVVDTTGAGDTFTAALTVALARRQPVDEALKFACTAGALATTKNGAQPSLPLLEQVESFKR